MSSPRPTSVTLIGWLWLVLGSFGLLGGLVPVAVMSFVPVPATVEALGSTLPAADPEVLEPFLEALAPLFHYGWIFVLAHLGLSFFSLVAGIGLLRLKSWARAGLEGLSWLYLIQFVAGAVLWLQLQRSLSDIIRQHVSIVEMEMVVAGATEGIFLSGLTVFGVMGTLAVAMIWALRRTTVRAAMTG